MAQIQVTLRLITLYALFAVLILVYFAVMVEAAFYQSGGGMVLKGISDVGSVLQNEILVVNLLVPAVLGGLIALSAPNRATFIQFCAILVLSFVTWFLFLHLQLYVDTNNTMNAGLALSQAGVTRTKIPEALDVISKFTSGVRNFGAATFAAVLGLRLADGKSDNPG